MAKVLSLADRPQVKLDTSRVCLRSGDKYIDIQSIGQWSSGDHTGALCVGVDDGHGMSLQCYMDFDVVFEFFKVYIQHKGIVETFDFDEAYDRIRKAIKQVGSGEPIPEKKTGRFQVRRAKSK